MNIRNYTMIFIITYLKNKIHLKKNINFNKSLLVILLSAVMIFGCTKPEDIGQEIVALPGEELDVSFTDTVTVVSYSYLHDSLASSGLSKHFLGSVFDPIFGTTAASIYTQVRLSNNDLDFGTNAVCDSIVFGFDYAGFYGDTAATQHLKIYQLDESLSIDSLYYSNKEHSIIQPALFEGDIIFNFKDSIAVTGGKLKPHLRIKLDNSLGEDIVSKSGQSELSNNEEFLKYIKGFYITADQINNGGGMAMIDLMSGYSRITLYYHNDEDTTFEYFVINENCSRYSYLNHFDYQGSDPDFYNQVVLKNTSLGMQTFYMQPTAGVRTYIDFPYLKNLIKDNQVAVQKAELILSIDGGSDTANYTPPLTLTLAGISDEGVSMKLTDFLEGPSFFGGVYDRDNNQYIFNLTRTIQEVLLDKSEWNGYRLIVNGEAVSANRAIFNGNSVNTNKTRLRIYFTDVNP